MRKTQPLLVRLTHWLNVPVLVLMAMSGLEILAAYPSLGPRGRLFRWYAFNGHAPPSFTRYGGWLAGARQLHFTFAWLFVANGLAYLIYLLASGQWRDRWFLPWRDSKNAVHTAAYYMRLRKTAPEQGLYNGLQRLGYMSASLLALVSALSGLAIYKPVQLWPLCRLFGGYDAARAVHLLSLGSLALFTLGHLLMVAIHYKRFAEMITGGPPRG